MPQEGRGQVGTHCLEDQIPHGSHHPASKTRTRTPNLRMYDRFALIQRDLCRVEGQVLENAINTLAGSSNRYALNLLLGPGHWVATVGATAYVTCCQGFQAARIE